MKYGMQSEEPLEKPFLKTRPKSHNERKLAPVPERVGSGRGRTDDRFDLGARDAGRAGGEVELVLFTPGATRARVLYGGVKKGDQGRLGLPGPNPTPGVQWGTISFMCFKGQGGLPST